ncbi:uncharacterized protein LOC120182144 [Hibiscus syriacus]|uniref:uncharacterized protein LOC120182144 n=1 Tax=Hibiscus syriacus TaxID=106335 RepID=UPI001923D663|nr:uncharacterized protein LOC120182144 [Hibiscus syriacus]
MKKLARQFQNSEDEKFRLPTVDEDRPMEINDHIHEYDYRLLMLLDSVKLHNALYFKTRYHAYFKDYVDSWMIITSDWVAILACSMAIMGLFSYSKDHKKWKRYSCSLDLVLAIFWIYHLLRMPKFRWDVIWLPLGPLCGAGVCLYVDHVLSESSEEVRKLMYAFKAG